MTSNPKVSIVRCSSYSFNEIERALREAVSLLGGMNEFVPKGKRVLLKPNLLMGKEPERAINTHPTLVQAVIRLVKEAGGKPFLGDSPAIEGTLKAAQKAGIGKVAREEATPLVDFKEAVEVDNPRGETFKRLHLARPALEADVLINLPKLKTHSQMLLTLAVKNLFGCVPGTLKASWHLLCGQDEDLFARMLLDIHERLRPPLTIMDAVVAMEGNGPSNGKPRHVGLLLASNDALTMDAVVCHLLGVKAQRLPTLRVAQRAGLKEAFLENIQIFGERIEDVKVASFQLPRPLALAWGLPDFLRGLLKNSLTHKPAIETSKCVLCKSCLEVCPSQALTFKDSQPIFDYQACIRCFCCGEVCPEGAVKTMPSRLGRLINKVSF